MLQHVIRSWTVWFVNNVHVCVYVCNNIAAAMGVDATAMYIAEAMLVVGWVDGIDVTVYLFLENERRVDEEGR